MVPGTRALAFAARWFDPATVSSVFEPLIADWQREWQDAIPARRARISARGLAAFMCAVIVSSPRIIRTSAPADVTNRIVRRIATFTLIAGVLNWVAMVTSWPDAWTRGGTALLMLPGALAVVYPFSLIAGIDALREARGLAPHVARAAASKVALVSVFLMVLFVGWISPLANITWRETVAARMGVNRPSHGVREFSTWRLIVGSSQVSHYDEDKYVGRSRLVARELSSRASIAVLPVLLIWLRWSAVARPRRSWYSPLPASLATLIAIVWFFGLWSIGGHLELRSMIPWGLDLWTPIAGLLGVGIASGWLQRERTKKTCDAF